LRNRSNYNNNGYDDNAIKLTALYQWNIDGGFNWYAGVGGGVGNYSYTLMVINTVILVAAGRYRYRIRL
jgi:hypothetical protein